MTKRFFLLSLILILCLTLSLSVFASNDAPRLWDGADLLTDSEKITLQQRLDDLSEQYKVEIIIATVDTVGNTTADAYVEYFYDENAYGYGETRDGVLLLVAMEEREYRILSNGFGAEAITTEEISYIGEIVASSLSEGDYIIAFNDFIDECEYQIHGEINGFPFEFAKNLIISLLIGFVVAFVVTGIMRSKLKSVRKQLTATVYTKPDSMQVKNSNEYFLYRTVSSRKKESNKSSGSGSSRNVGGGSF